MTEIQRVRNDLKLSEKRMCHTEGVVRAAVLLASRHFPEIAPETAELAALFHDYTKEYTVQQHLQVLASRTSSSTTSTKRLSQRVWPTTRRQASMQRVTFVT